MVLVVVVAEDDAVEEEEEAEEEEDHECMSDSRTLVFVIKPFFAVRTIRFSPR